MGDCAKPGRPLVPRQRLGTRGRKKVHHIEYVHDNLVRRGLVSCAVDWP
jgi:hypothetical protein